MSARTMTENDPKATRFQVRSTPFAGHLPAHCLYDSPSCLEIVQDIGVVSSTTVILPDHFDCGWSVREAANLVERREENPHE